MFCLNVFSAALLTDFIKVVKRVIVIIRMCRTGLKSDLKFYKAVIAHLDKSPKAKRQLLFGFTFLIVFFLAALR